MVTSGDTRTVKMYDILKKKPPLNYNGNGLTKNSEDFEYLTGYPEELWVKKTKDYNKSKLHKGLIKLDCDLDIKLNSAFMAGFYDGVKEADECGYKRGEKFFVSMFTQRLISREPTNIGIEDCIGGFRKFRVECHKDCVKSSSRLRINLLRGE